MEKSVEIHLFLTFSHFLLSTLAMYIYVEHFCVFSDDHSLLLKAVVIDYTAVLSTRLMYEQRLRCFRHFIGEKKNPSILSSP